MNVRLMLIGIPAGLVIAGLTACGSSTGGYGSGSASPQLRSPQLSSPTAQGRALTGSAGGSVSSAAASAPAAAGLAASDEAGNPTTPPSVVITRVVTVPAPAASSAATPTKSSPAPSSSPSPSPSSTAAAAPPSELIGPTSVTASALTAPACTSHSGDVDVQVSWTSTNADGVWTLTQSDDLVINDPRTDGGRHVARLGNTQFLFDCSVDTEYYIFRAYNATNYMTFLLLVSNNLP